MWLNYQTEKGKRKHRNKNKTELYCSDLIRDIDKFQHIRSNERSGWIERKRMPENCRENWGKPCLPQKRSSTCTQKNVHSIVECRAAYTQTHWMIINFWMVKQWIAVLSSANTFFSTSNIKTAQWITRTIHSNTLTAHFNSWCTAEKLHVAHTHVCI